MYGQCQDCYLHNCNIKALIWAWEVKTDQDAALFLETVNKDTQYHTHTYSATALSLHPPVYFLTVSQMHSLQIHVPTHSSQIEMQGSCLSNSSTHLSWATNALSLPHRQMTPAHEYDTQGPAHWCNRLPPSESDECTKSVTECMNLKQLCSALEEGESHTGWRGNTKLDVKWKEMKYDAVAWGRRRHLTRCWHRIRPC